MLTIEEIREALEDRNLSEVSRRMGGKYTGAYLRQIMSGKAKNPSYECIKAISEYLEPRKEKKE